MANTKISVEKSDKEGFWLASIDKDLGESQRLLFSYLVPIKPHQTVSELEEFLMSEAHKQLENFLGRR